MSEVRIGTCLKHGRNLASCEECGPKRIVLSPKEWGFVSSDYKRRLLEKFSRDNRAEVARLRAAGELRVACGHCDGRGENWARGSLKILRVCQRPCFHCYGTGWKWSEKR